MDLMGTCTCNLLSTQPPWQKHSNLAIIFPYIYYIGLIPRFMWRKHPLSVWFIMISDNAALICDWILKETDCVHVCVTNLGCSQVRRTWMHTASPSSAVDRFNSTFLWLFHLSPLINLVIVKLLTFRIVLFVIVVEQTKSDIGVSLIVLIKI